MFLLASCTRVNGAYEDDGAPSTSVDDGPESSATTHSDTSASSASVGAEGTSTPDSTNDGAPDPTTGGEGTTTTNGDGQENTSSTADGSDPTTGGAPPEACCSPEGACENQEVSECACAADMDRCCDQAWDIYCVVLAVSQGCVECGAAPPHDCCMGSVSPGCNDYDLMACVCAENTGCCDQAWEPGCAAAAADCPESPCL